MKQKTPIIFVILTLWLFAFQNAYSEEDRTIRYEDSTTTRYVLWRVYIQEPPDSTYQGGGIKVMVDSVLREDFYAKEKWFIYFFRKKDRTHIGVNSIPNAYYLVLAHAICSKEKIAETGCSLYLKEEDSFLPDTPENRKLLSKKRDEAKITYVKKVIRNRFPSGMMID